VEGKALDLLAEVNTIKAKPRPENADLTPLAAEFNQTSQNRKIWSGRWKKLVSMMEQDPLADTACGWSHKAMQESLKAMNQATVKNAQAALLTQNKPAAVENLEEMAPELERMSALSENLSKNQHARDVLEAGRSLEEVGERFAGQVG